ncbi:hypothetical protein G6F24_015164 [Rhizopus arrhizus]|nr:hypothetical protein G6F24_015164 [Rhizopus arrhizus]
MPATRSRSDPRGPKAASAPAHANPQRAAHCCCAPAPIRAACRAMRSADDLHQPVPFQPASRPALAQGVITMTLRFKRLLRACAFGLALAAPALSQAAWPEKPITLIVPWAAGGSTDILARVLSEGLTQSLGQSVIVDNRSGASGNIGTPFVARAKPDGYTLLVGSMSTHTMNQALYSNMPNSSPT